MMKRWLLPKRLERITQFSAVDPHYHIQGEYAASLKTEFLVETYKPKIWNAPQEAIIYAIKSENEGLPRMLPWALTELWFDKTIRLEALPEILYWLEPGLVKQDFEAVWPKKVTQDWVKALVFSSTILFVFLLTILTIINVLLVITFVHSELKTQMFYLGIILPIFLCGALYSIILRYGFSLEDKMTRLQQQREKQKRKLCQQFHLGT